MLQDTDEDDVNGSLGAADDDDQGEVDEDSDDDPGDDSDDADDDGDEEEEVSISSTAANESLSERQLAEQAPQDTHGQGFKVVFV
jgi:hypothetical protein